MLSREGFIALVKHEVETIKHLYTKIPPGKLDFRPTPGQRSLQELLEYLPTCSAGVAKVALANNFAQRGAGIFEPIREAARRDFVGTMDAQFKIFEELIKGVPESDFNTKEVNMPGGRKFPLGVALVSTTLRMLAAYRMQLFLYLKQCGRPELNTMNCWMGMDAPPPQK